MKVVGDDYSMFDTTNSQCLACIRGLQISVSWARGRWDPLLGGAYVAENFEVAFFPYHRSNQPNWKRNKQMNLGVFGTRE